MHQSFAHPSTDKLLKLLKNTGGQWANNKELQNEIKNITEKYKVCKIFKKPPPHPVVSLPMASHFQETVAMDLKIYHGQYILHLIDLCTCLPAATFIPNKNREAIIKHIFRIWIAAYGTPEKFFTDNNGEFANSEFLEMADHLSTIAHITAAESPWSNGSC